MSEWKNEGGVWRFGDVTMEFDPDYPLPWSAWFGTRSGHSRATPIEALDMLARYLAEDWQDIAAVAEVCAAREAWVDGGSITISGVPNILSVVDDSGVTMVDMLRRIENMEEALADALATIAELRREIRDVCAREGL